MAKSDATATSEASFPFRTGAFAQPRIAGLTQDRPLFRGIEQIGCRGSRHLEISRCTKAEMPPSGEPHRRRT